VVGSTLYLSILATVSKRHDPAAAGIGNLRGRPGWCVMAGLDPWAFSPRTLLGTALIGFGAIRRRRKTV
jgi:hypothetical protein